MIRLCSRFDSVLFTPKISEIPSYGNYSRSPREYFSDLRISENERATKEAILQSDIAKADAAKANEGTKEAELKLALLDKKITPRVISDEHGEDIIDKLKLFPETPFSVEADPAAEYG